MPALYRSNGRYVVRVEPAPALPDVSHTKGTCHVMPKRGNSRILSHNSGWKPSQNGQARARFVRDTRPTLGVQLSK